MRYIAYVKSKADVKARPNLSIRVISRLTNVPKWMQDMELPIWIDTQENQGCFGEVALEKLKLPSQFARKLDTIE